MKYLVNINMDGLGEVGKVFIEKVSEGIGGAFKPWQNKRVARANAEVAIMEAQTDIEVNTIQQRGLNRLLYEESQKQENIEGITCKALPYLNKEDGNPGDIDKDWMVNFLNKCRLISDDDMQSIWARILAGEANVPGSFSKRTINFMESLDKKEAKWFSDLCAFKVELVESLNDAREEVPFIVNYNEKIYSENGITFLNLKNLEAIGLISYSRSGFQREIIPKSRIDVDYQGTSITLDYSEDNKNALWMGKALFTNIGQELSKVCVPRCINGFSEYMIKVFNKNKVPVILENQLA